MVVPYKHEPFTDFKDPANREAFEKALQKSAVNSEKNIRWSSTANGFTPKINWFPSTPPTKIK